MNLSALLKLFTMVVLAHCAAARIPSLGQSTVQAERSELPDRAFLVRRTRRPQSVGPGRRYFVFSTSPERNPALAAPDTQVQVNTVVVKAGRLLFKHYHPRGTEVVTLQQGRLFSQTWFEGGKPRVVRNTLYALDSTVYPQGLPHLVRCVSKIDCIFTAIFNSADAGTVIM